MRIIYIVLLICAFTYATLGQDLKPYSHSNGLILHEGVILGTGFVYREKNIVVTCFHVTGGKKHVKYICAGDSKEYNLVLIRYDQQQDLIIYKSLVEIQSYPLLTKTWYNVNINDTIHYAGYEIRNIFHRYNLKESKSIVNNINYSFGIGNFLLPKYPKQVIEFRGEAFYGYSGGPVVNSEGNLVGIVGLMRDFIDDKGSYEKKVTCSAYSTRNLENLYFSYANGR